jgi:hypothetical protein
MEKMLACCPGYLSTLERKQEPGFGPPQDDELSEFI